MSGSGRQVEGTQAPTSQPPTTQAPTPQAPTPAPTPGSGWQNPGTGGGGSGCVKVALILLGLAFAGLVGLALLAGNFLNNIAPGGNGSGEGFIGGDDCAFLSDTEARAVLGGQADAVELAGFYDASIGLIIDKRALPDAPDCFVTEGDRAFLARIAVSDGNGPGVFTAERERAAPTSQDQGGGVTVENSGYFGGEVASLGDEAFCTGISDAIMGGVVVRQGDRVVAVSVGGAAEGQPVPDMVTTPEGVVTSPGLCALAQELARAVLE